MSDTEVQEKPAASTVKPHTRVYKKPPGPAKGAKYRTKKSIALEKENPPPPPSESESSSDESESSSDEEVIVYKSKPKPKRLSQAKKRIATTKQTKAPITKHTRTKSLTGKATLPGVNSDELHNEIKKLKLQMEKMNKPHSVPEEPTPKIKTPKQAKVEHFEHKILNF